MPRTRTGFTLIEVLVVLGIVALLLTLAVPRFFPSVDSAKETVLLENLRNTRIVIDQFHADTGRYPESLDELVQKRYLRSLPFDPVAESNAAWVVEPPQEPDKGGVYNLRSSAEGTGRNGIAYGEW